MGINQSSLDGVHQLRKFCKATLQISHRVRVGVGGKSQRIAGHGVATGTFAKVMQSSGKSACFVDGETVTQRGPILGLKTPEVRSQGAPIRGRAVSGNQSGSRACRTDRAGGRRQELREFLEKSLPGKRLPQIA